MKKINFIILLVVALTHFSCGDFLNESPRHQWDVDKAMTTYSNAVQSVNGIYGIFMPGDDFNMALSTSYTNRSGLFDKLEKDNRYEYTQSDSPVNYWGTAYKMINAANLAINGIPNVPDAAFPTATTKNELIGEAKLLRGYAYSILLLNYGLWWDTDDSKYGVVYRDKTTDVENTNQPRISVGESWKKIFEDIDYAIANMSDKFNSAKTASKFFAKAYKAKLLLIRGAERNSADDIKTAKTLIDECISSLPSDVAVQGSMVEHFAQSWDSKENIFVRYLEDDANRTDRAGYACCYNPGYNYFTNFIVDGVVVSQADAVCGLKYGVEWMREDPRWYIATGKARKSETWDNTYTWTWTKIYRKGKYAGKIDPIDEKYAVYLMRVPELYLMQAELRARTGASLAESIAPINMFRAKRTTPKLDKISTPANAQEFWDILFQEYCKELIFENGCEYYASLRINKNGHSYMEEIKGPDFHYDKTKRQFPIPHTEMINNQAIAGMQNPGQD
ncbi:MAG: RagB/SusD family nutrient uptake outer membrane protein [Bacteroidales bacterium]